MGELQRISAIFIRLPDQSILDLWNGTPQHRYDDPGITYNHDDLTSVLSAIMVEMIPNHILTMDNTNAFSGDHPDHYGSAYFALEAAQNWNGLGSLQSYRGYSVTLDGRNLTTPQHDEKVRLMGLYGAGVGAGSDYDDWCWRQYSSSVSVR